MLNRSNTLVSIFVIYIAVLLTPFELLSDNYGTFKGVEFINCYDGDTCRFNIPGVHPIIGKNISVRLDGVDTPEIRGKCQQEKQMAQEAKIFINNVFRSLKPGDKINLVNLKRGKYFRLVATIQITLNGNFKTTNINALLIKKGYAVPYKGKTKHHQWCDPEKAIPTRSIISPDSLL